MTLVVYWYDVVCFGIIGAAVLVSMYMLWKNEGAERHEDKSLYESLMIPRLDSYYEPTGVDVTPIAYVGSSQLWTSCWRGVHPGWLLGVRVISFFVLAGLLAWDIQEWGGSIFIYYTEWTFALVMMYFAVGSVVSAHGCWLYYIENTIPENVVESEVGGDIEASRTKTNRVFRGKGFDKGAMKLQSQYYQEQALERAGFWGYLMQIAYQTCAGAVVLTDSVFWCIIVPLMSNSRLGLNLLMGCMHTVNIALLLLDTSLNRLPFPWFRLSYFVLWSSAYVLFQWLIHFFGFSWWPYPFLELSTPWAPLWYLALAVFQVACYGMYALIVRVKDSLFSQLFPDSYMVVLSLASWVSQDLEV